MPALVLGIAGKLPLALLDEPLQLLNRLKLGRALLLPRVDLRLNVGHFLAACRREVRRAPLAGRHQAVRQLHILFVAAEGSFGTHGLVGCHEARP